MLPNNVIWTTGDIITELKMDGMTNNDAGLADGTAISSAAIISRHLKPMIDLVYGSTGTIINANQDYDVATINITLPVYATGYNVWAIFTGWCQMNSPAWNSVKFWNNGVANVTPTNIAKSTGGQEHKGACMSWKITATAGAKIYKITCRSNAGMETNCQGSLLILATSQ
jgi:hypothetical protein